MASDSGMMGGNLSHEFMLLTPAGEDSIVLCPECGYSANMEAAACIYSAAGDSDAEADGDNVAADGAACQEGTSAAPVQMCIRDRYNPSRNSPGYLFLQDMRG